MPRVEFKAHCLRRSVAEAALERFGAIRLGRGADTERHFHPGTGHIKYYERSSYEAGLIGHFRTVPSDAGAADTGVRTAGAGGDSAVARRDTVYAGPGWTVAFDRLAGYDFLSVEVDDVEAAGTGAALDTASALNTTSALDTASALNTTSALDTAERLRIALAVGYLDIVPWSYPQLANIISSAQRWRAALGDLDGRLFLIDGPSGAGKSTLARVLREESTPGYTYVPRVSSRARRTDDVASDEYLPISIDDFRVLAEQGNFLEYREFKFQMGYGLRWSDVASTLRCEGTRAAYALVNLGNSRHIQRFVPDATTVLVTGPLDQLEGRMMARAAHPPAAIAERLENARRGAEAASISDHVIENGNGRLDDSVRAIRKIVYG